MCNNGAPTQPMARSTNNQIQILVNYMARNKEFANGLGAYSGAAGNNNEHWEELRTLLKKYGADKTVMQWKRTWQDLKMYARKAVRNSKELSLLLSDTIIKILETISHCSSLEVDTETLPTVEVVTMEEWEVASEHSLPGDSEGMCNKHRVEDSSASDKSVPDCDEEEPVECSVAVQKGESQNNNDSNVSSTRKHASEPLQALDEAQPRPPRASPRRHSLAARRRTAQMFWRPYRDYLALEHRRLTLEEKRDRRLHEREIERIKLELQRVEVQRNHNELLHHLVGVAERACDLVQAQLG